MPINWLMIFIMCLMCLFLLMILMNSFMMIFPVKNKNIMKKINKNNFKKWKWLW
nr:TPA_asm: ATP8 [Bombus impatiens]